MREEKPHRPTLVPTFVASTLQGKFEKAALRRFMCPQLFCVLWAVEIAEVAFHASLVSCADCWDATAEDVDWPKRALRNRLAIHFACCVTSTSIRCFVLSGFHFRHWGMTTSRGMPTSRGRGRSYTPRGAALIVGETCVEILVLS